MKKVLGILCVLVALGFVYGCGNSANNEETAVEDTEIATTLEEQADAAVTTTPEERMENQEANDAEFSEAIN